MWFICSHVCRLPHWTGNTLRHEMWPSRNSFHWLDIPYRWGMVLGQEVYLIFFTTVLLGRYYHLDFIDEKIWGWERSSMLQVTQLLRDRIGTWIWTQLPIFLSQCPQPGSCTAISLLMYMGLFAKQPARSEWKSTQDGLSKPQAHPTHSLSVFGSNVNHTHPSMLRRCHVPLPYKNSFNWPSG